MLLKSDNDGRVKVEMHRNYNYSGVEEYSVMYEFIDKGISSYRVHNNYHQARRHYNQLVWDKIGWDYR